MFLRHTYTILQLNHICFIHVIYVLYIPYMAKSTFIYGWLCAIYVFYFPYMNKYKIMYDSLVPYMDWACHIWKSFAVIYGLSMPYMDTIRHICVLFSIYEIIYDSLVPYMDWGVPYMEKFCSHIRVVYAMYGYNTPYMCFIFNTWINMQSYMIHWCRIRNHTWKSSAVIYGSSMPYMDTSSVYVNTCHAEVVEHWNQWHWHRRTDISGHWFHCTHNRCTDISEQCAMISVAKT